MNHKKYKEWVQLFLYGELTQDEKDELQKHLDDCNECSAELEKQQRFFSVLSHTPLPEPDKNLLSEARRELNAALKVEKTKDRWFAFPNFSLSEFFFSPLRLAFGGTAVLAAGILIGFLLFNNSEKVLPLNEEENSLALLEETTQVKNVRFIDNDPSDGEIEFTVDAVKPLRIKGNVSDPEIQNILTHSILFEDNPGVRLNAINLINTNALENNDEEIKAALITVAKYDSNLGVRREALKLLRSYPFDSGVREALLYILLNDENSSMRIEAITSLKEIGGKGSGFNQDEISAFREKVNKEENNYVKFQMKTALQENIQNEK
ncbi:MAG: hypothetical protein EHM47_09610 [Ignavibacteriales bacterium]|nr:MAG: hypothetical protein EHM47_09610 [Ignavibacteriales bacterium]